ncbi:MULTISPECIES: MFS transporter [Pseudomonas]|uniref:MFS transporter n=1 Tax=Pseudomonas spirodelae TaxID=3101751 RepID=A0ABU5PE49_9PSED|nr:MULTISPECIES: MFS transporter [unclassified Pseudomonas]MBU0902651.1 MFS transporter [Gammaproteobacteria bacterium]MDD2162355.1 MFS transporter [Pseudomonas sp. MIL19]MEA1607951.1 MFS transporter [Pseudomonas sp. T5W1]
MDALLILGGLLLILAGLVWLVMRAFTTSLLWGWASLLPPFTLLYVLRHWPSARPALLLSGLGIIPLVVGLTLLASHDAQRLEAILSLSWLKPEVQAPAELAIDLRGQLNGRPFAPQQAELLDGVLSLREGQDFFAQSELVIRLPEIDSGPVQIDVLPADTGALPEVEISWLLPEQELPEARRLSRGYTLHLNLQPVAPNKLAGDFHLVMPAQFKTTLSGKLELFRNGLRYQGEEVDRQFDSVDTVSYVIHDYLERRFATRQVQLQPIGSLNFPLQSIELNVSARINGNLQQLPITLQKLKGRGWQVASDNFAAVPSAVIASAAEKPETLVAALPERVTRPLDRRVRFSLEGLLRSPSRYYDLNMRAVTERGNTAEGRFQGVDQDERIILRQRMNGRGEVSYRLLPQEIIRIELLEP